MALVALGLFAGACGGAPGPSIRAPSSGPSTAVSTSAAPPVAASHSARPASATPATIPGFDGWTANKPLSVAVSTDGASLVLRLTHQAMWFNADRGVLFSKPMEGDVRVTATVRVAKTSDPTAAPGGSGVVQLAGLMMRADREPEDYAFVVVGDDGDGTSVETKSTDDSVSVYDGPRWPEPIAELRLCRVGAAVTAYKRVAGSGAAWTRAATYDRPDLPAALQVGVNIYSSGPPDITAHVDGLEVTPISGASDCTAD